MKPFDPTKPVQTRDGLPARILCTDKKVVSPYCIVALVGRGDVESTGHFAEDGRCYVGKDSSDDLINIPAEFEFERWVNVYADDQVSSGETYRTKEDADIAGRSSAVRIACVRVVIKGKEGDGL